MAEMQKTVSVPTGEVLAPLKGKVTKATNKGDKLEIKTDADLEVAADLVGDIKIAAKEIRKLKGTVLDPLSEAVKATRAIFKPVEDRLKEGEAMIKSKMVDYELAKEEEVKAKEAEIAEKMKEGEMSPSDVVEAMQEADGGSNEPVRTKKATTSFRKGYEATIIDESLVPKEYWIVDEARVKAQSIENVKVGIDAVPGVAVKETKIPSVRV